MTARGAVRALGAALVLAGCLDDTPTDPSAGASSPAELVPATAWLEAGASLRFALASSQPFTLESGDPSVVAIGADGLVHAVRPGAVELRALTPFGRSRARVTVLPPTASRGATARDSGLTDASLLGLWSVDRDVHYAVGVPNTVLETRDGGRTWSRVRLATRADFTGVWAADRDNVWVVGSGGTILHYDGLRWRPEPSGTERTLLEVWGRSASDVYAVGAGVALHYDGDVWRPMPGAEGAELWAVWGGDSTLFASGQNGVILRWDGARWQPMASPTPFVLFGLWGTGPGEVHAAGARGTVLRFDGQAWQLQPVPTGADLFALVGGGGRLVAVGNFGAMLVRSTGVWSFAPPPGTRENLRAVAFDPDGVIRIAGWSGTVVRGGAGGWTEEISAPPLFASALAADGALVAVGTGGAVYRLGPEGPARMPVPVRRDLYGVSVRRGGLTAVGDSGTILHYEGGAWSLEGLGGTSLLRSIWTDPADPGRSLIVGDGGLILAGATGRWVTEPSPTRRFLRHVHGIAGGPVFAVGDSGTVLRREAGRWDSMPTPVAVRLRGVWARAPDDVHAVGEDGVALRFDGRRWFRVATPTDRELRAVFGVGPTEVYAVGAEGTVLRFDGAAWTSVPSPTASLLLGLGAGAAGTLVAVGTNRMMLELR